jgi:hypothetical protein
MMGSIMTSSEMGHRKSSDHASILGGRIRGAGGLARRWRCQSEGMREQHAALERRHLKLARAPPMHPAWGDYHGECRQRDTQYGEHGRHGGQAQPGRHRQTDHHKECLS